MLIIEPNAANGAPKSLAAQGLVDRSYLCPAGIARHPHNQVIAITPRETHALDDDV
ncbi:MAG: hypothetical protein ACRYG8_10315 [Janthinobacterium lividum]